MPTFPRNAMALPADLHEEIKREPRDCVLSLIAPGVDAVLDFAFRSRRVRAPFRELLRPIGHRAGDHLPRNATLHRIRADAGHGQKHAYDYALPADVAAGYFDHFR